MSWLSWVRWASDKGRASVGAARLDRDMTAPCRIVRPWRTRVRSVASDADVARRPARRGGRGDGGPRPNAARRGGKRPQEQPEDERAGKDRGRLGAAEALENGTGVLSQPCAAVVHGGGRCARGVGGRPG